MELKRSKTPVSWSLAALRPSATTAGGSEPRGGGRSRHACGPHLLTHIHQQLRFQHTEGGRGFLSQEGDQIVTLKQRFWGREAGKRVQAEGTGRGEAPWWESACAPVQLKLGGGKWGQRHLSGKGPVGDSLPGRVRISGATRAIQGAVVDTGPPTRLPRTVADGLRALQPRCHPPAFLARWVALGPASCRPSAFASGGTPVPGPALPAHLSCSA